jgi:DNA segregation ATPase FtsK/SpoIIIE, S-DNA-T family
VVGSARLVGVGSSAVVHAPPQVWGLAVVAAAAVAGLSVYRRGAGTVGTALGFVLSLAIGRLDALAPIALAAAGVMLFGPRLRAQLGRVAIGTFVTGVAAAGLVHLGAGNLSLHAPLARLRAAGGILGALIARPASEAVGTVSVWLALVAVGCLGLMIVSATPFSRVVAWTRTALETSTAFVAALTQGRSDAAEAAAAAHAEPDALEEEDAAPEPGAPGAEAESEIPIAGPVEQLAMPVGDGRGYRLPPVELLARSDERRLSAGAIAGTISVLEATLEQFNVDAAVTGHVAGPTVTRFEVELGQGVKVSKVISLSDEIKYALASGELRFLNPIPGRSAIGIEVPNRVRQLVTLGDVLRSKEAQSNKHSLTVPLGKDISGQSILANLTEMPHLLIAGATNSGKSSCINSMISSILMRARPDQVRMVLIDPKRVELSHFAGVPHLITPVVTQPRRAASALGWVVREMEMRYELLAHCGMRNLEIYNEAAANGSVVRRNDDESEATPLPYILVVVDELSDLMMVAPRDVEAAICRIAQMARAVGIHLVVATQRPSVDVVTGLIKANIPSRLAFSVASQQDSRVILDHSGADKLVGVGDMLFLHANSSKPHRLQGAWVSEKEMASVVGHCRRQRPAHYVEGVTADDAGPEAGPVAAGEDDLLDEALELVVRSQLGSTSMLQRKLKVGFARAGRLMDLLEQRGVVGESHGSKPRTVLMTPDELEELRSGGESEAGG